jgi:hypothetical protein
MIKIQSFFKNLYQNFNDRNIDPVIASMTKDVQWANGMDGGYVFGHDGVRAYWTRQFGLITSSVTPLEISEDNNIVKIKVHQVVYDINETLLSDDIVYHYFTLKDDKIDRFDIGEKHPIK